MLKLKTPFTRMNFLVKSDRINVLKKQYDAFLEEDKKRKDRNDYILGRLDKMRYSSTAVQLRHTPNTCRDYFAPSYNRYNSIPENVERSDMQMVHVNQQLIRPSYNNLQLDVPRNYVEEATILKEISKKYILIPKLRTTFPQDGPEVIPTTIPAPVTPEKPSDIDNNDWKSKYDILEQLKNKEKEEEISKSTTEDETFRKNNQDKANNIMHTNVREELPTRYDEEIPEKDVSDQLLVENELKGFEKCSINEQIDQISSANVAHIPSASLNSENVAPYYIYGQNEALDQNSPEFTAKINEGMEHYTQPEQYVNPAEQKAISSVNNNQYKDNYQEHELQPQQEQEYPIEYEQFMPNTETDTSNTELEKVVDQEENDYSPIEVINPNELVDEINKDDTEKEGITTETVYPAEIANTQEPSPEEAYQQTVLQDGQSTNPENYMTDDGTIVQGNPVPRMLNEDPTDNSGIEDFDAEQREMFYSEQAAENYNYDDQGAAGDAYNAEYAQNQNYPQAQEYAYYEGTQPEEGTYPVEINEHEETQQLYDQHYEQQYAANYEQGYDQQAVYMEQDPTQPQFEEPALYDQAQQEFEQYTLDQQPAETQEQVEQVLDQEDGYIQKRVEDPTAQEDQQTAELNVP